MKRIQKTSFWGWANYLCAICGKKVGYLDKFCSRCGSAVEWERCPHCNNISELMKDGFCSNCGTPLLRRQNDGK